MSRQKKCIKCSENKPLNRFCRDRVRPSGLHPYCKDCMKLAVSYIQQYSIKKQKGNAAYQHTLAREKKRYWNNKEAKLEYAKRWYQENKEHALEQAKQYRIQNTSKRTAWNTKRRCQKIHATPSWYKQEKEKIEQLYAESSQRTKDTGIQHHVDHIIPLLSEHVCGLHCLSNLRIITADENAKKYNTLIQELAIVPSIKPLS